MPLPDMQLAESVESLERATVQAVAPERVLALPGWLLPMDHGTVGRARSAVPLCHGAVETAVVDEVIERYAAFGTVAAWRLPDLPGFDTLQADLRARGWRREQPTLTQVADVATMAAVADRLDTVVAEQPDAGWLAMFLGEGLDPLDGEHRSRALARAPQTRFVSVVQDGVTLACGAASLSHGWLGVHGMRTALHARGRGLAARVLAAMAGEARRHGLERAFLQVDAGNAPALALYRRAGFVTAWPYAYWRRPRVAGN